ncbi:glycoside hydrolase family 13 protein [Fructilactobacillus cliffordii]|uniref:Alpha-glucosidase n=1 Tax=Fructilactobacillus cliffordii TaxID=2940299 RepID=A0A9Q8ZP31_9LACO|nr:alpha-glucosidase [Fructilactobacillus cliffordii]USS88975.1 alpha-glucosidase [Fructilactobacillus cliffordii]
MQRTQPAWWQDEIIYEIYPRSFNDSNGDGIGDLPGITAKLDYLQELGVTMLWLAPVYRSPMVDMGYDIADYQAIDPVFGTMADMEELLSAAHDRGLKVIMDLVLNHTSDQHPWFQEALRDPTSPYRDYYIFKSAPAAQAPTNWRGIFGGSTWTAVPDDPETMYFHTFTAAQPDLNWENPELRQQLYRIINWWLAKGIAGFRLDAITHLKKDQDWDNLPADGPDGLVSVTRKGLNRPGLGKFLQELKEATFARHDSVTIGEAAGVRPDQLAEFVGPAGYFSMIFDFSYLNIDVTDANQWEQPRDWTTTELADTIFTSQRAIQTAQGVFANVLENHDQNRALTKFIKNPVDRTPAAAKALATLSVFLPGVPVLYQGQELGMHNFTRHHIEEFNDVSSINNYQRLIKAGKTPDEALAIVNWRSRDNARVPMPWDDSRFGGFSTGTPWLNPVTVKHGINVAAEQADPESVLHYYQQLLRLQQQPQYRDVLRTGQFEPLVSPAAVIAYRRQNEQHRLLVLVNLERQPISLAHRYQGRILLENLSTKVSEKETIIDQLAPQQALIMEEL